MSVMTETHAPRAGRLSAFFQNIAKSVAQYRLYRETLAELQDLSDRELADLGLNRSVLRSVAYASVYNG